MRGSPALHAAGACLTAVAALAACGGGGGGSGSVQPPVSASRAGSTAFTFTVPAASPSSRGRNPRYVSSATHSLSVDVVYPSAPRTTTIANFAANAPGCSTTPGGLSCTVVVTTQDGAQTFVLTAFDGPNGTGNPLSTATIPVPPMTGVQTAVPVTLDGIVQSVSFSLQGTFKQGVAASLPLLVIAKDAAGAIIIAPGTYTVPIALQSSDTSGAFTLSTKTVAAPGATVTLTYNGAPSAGTIVSAIAGAVPVGTVSVGFGGSPGPTPTAVPTATATPVATATPIAKPTATPAATPTPTPSPVPTATFPVTIHSVRG
jgi:hypothetical protein